MSRRKALWAPGFVAGVLLAAPAGQLPGRFGTTLGESEIFISGAQKWE